jgi:AraC-like DNA-binding protein/quercetin dioxygenase-like cupin family protein
MPGVQKNGGIETISAPLCATVHASAERLIFSMDNAHRPKRHGSRPTATLAKAAAMGACLTADRQRSGGGEFAPGNLSAPVTKTPIKPAAVHGRAGIDASPVGPMLDFVLHNAKIKVNVCTRQQFETGYLLAPRTVPDYNFIFVTRGHIVWVIDGVDHHMHRGDMVLVPPGVMHRGYSVNKRVTLGSVHVNVTLSAGQDVFELLTPPRQMHFTKRSKMYGYFSGFVDEFDRGNESLSFTFAPGWGRLITLQWLIDAARQELLVYRPVDPLILAMLRELDMRAERPTTLDDLAKWSGFSPQHLNRLFSNTLGVTPLKYLTRLRLEKSAAMIAEGRLTIRAIAARLAFDDPYHFSRVFRQHFGRSPVQYRETLGTPAPK